MKKSIFKDIESELKKLGIYQIGGGSIGLMGMIKGFFLNSNSSGFPLLVYSFMILSFSYSIYCGILCTNGIKNALKHSQLNQVFQVLGVALMGFAYQYVAGVYLTIGLDLADSINITFAAGVSKFDLNINKQHERLEVNFNLVAFALIYWIDQLLKKVKLQAAKGLADSIN